MQTRRRILLLFSLAAASLSAAGPAPQYSAATNFAVDLGGERDTRPGTWGTAGSFVWKIHFLVPAEYRVRIVRVYGDFLAWPKGRVPEGTYSGALFGLQTSAPEGSKFADLMADNCFLYLQVATGGKPERAGFDHVVAAGGLLATDNTLYGKVAVWLNDTGLAIHMEPSWVTVFQIENASGIPKALTGGKIAVTASNGRETKRTIARRLQ